MNVPEASRIRRYHAPDDGRLLGLLVPAGFSDHSDHPPHDGRRAHVGDAELPLQIVVAQGELGDRGKPHVHQPLEAARSWPARHKVMICQRGSVRVVLSAGSDGTPAATVDLRPGDTLLILEGHQVEYLEDGTRIVEVKQGPFPGSMEADRQELTPP